MNPAMMPRKVKTRQCFNANGTPKTPFATADLAARALALADPTRRHVPQRFYQCKQCGRYHLTHLSFKQVDGR